MSNALIKSPFVADSMATIFTNLLLGTAAGKFQVQAFNRPTNIGNPAETLVEDETFISAGAVGVKKVSTDPLTPAAWIAGGEVGSVIVRKLKVRRRGSRFLVYDFGLSEAADVLPADNITFELDLPYSSFSSFGDFISKIHKGDIPLASIDSAIGPIFPTGIHLNQSTGVLSLVRLGDTFETTLGDMDAIFVTPVLASSEVFE